MRSKSGGGSSNPRGGGRRRSERGYESCWWCCRGRGGPRLGCRHFAAGLLSFSSGRGGGGEGRGRSAGDRAAGRARVLVPPPRRVALGVGAVNRSIGVRGEPTGPASPASSPHLGFGTAALGGLGRERGGGSGRATFGVGSRGGWPGRVWRWGGPGRGKGPTRRRGCPGKFDFNSPLVGGGSELGQWWGAGLRWGTPVRRRLLLDRRGLLPSRGARGAAGPRGSLLRSSNEWAPRRLRAGAEPRGKTSPESGLRSHDGGKGGERDEWRKRVGDGLGVNREALLCVTQRGGLAGDSSLRLSTYAAAAG